MKTSIVVNKWVRVTLFGGLLALLAIVDIQAMDAEMTDPVVLIQEGLAAPVAPCALEPQDGDPLMSFDNSDMDCVSFETPEVRSVEFTGNIAWATVVVGDETELHVYKRTDAGWDRIPYVSRSDDEYLWMIEQEEAAQLANVNPALQSAIVSTTSTGSGTAPSFNASMAEGEALLTIEELLFGPDPYAGSLSAIDVADASSFDSRLADREAELALDERVYGPALPAASSTESSFDVGLVDWEAELALDELIFGPASTAAPTTESSFDVGLVDWEAELALDELIFGPYQTARSSSRSESSWVTPSEEYWSYLSQLEGEVVGPAPSSETAWWDFMWAPQGEAYLDYLAELEGTDVGR